MPCCSEIAKGVRSSNSILDYLFKIIFCIISLPFIAVALPLKYIFYPASIFYSSLVFFDREFLVDVNKAIIGLNSARMSCRIAAYLHRVSPKIGGIFYKNFGYILITIITLCVLCAYYYLCQLIQK